MTPDHEPQDTLMQYVADELRWEKNERLFSDTSLKRDYSKDAGICLNLHELRHRHTLSYGRSRSAAVAPILAARNEAVEEGDTKKQARKRVGNAVIESLRKDQGVVKEIYRGSLAANLSRETKSKVTQGLGEVQTLNEEKFFKAFDE